MSQQQESQPRPGDSLIHPQRFTSVKDVYDVQGLLESALQIKSDPAWYQDRGRGKALGLVFFNPSLRTRLSSQRAAQLLGMDCLIMNANQDGWQIETQEGVIMDGDKQEHLSEAVGVLSQYCDVLGLRSFAGLQDAASDAAEELLEQFIRYATVPVLSLESATRHPLQSLADLITIKEEVRKPNPKVVLTWAPHPRPLPQAVPASFAEWMLAADMDLHIAHPEGFALDPAITEGAQLYTDQEEALAGADVVYVKNWSATSPYGQAAPERKEWLFDAEKQKLCPEAKIMHCLPVRRNVVISDDVLDSPQAIHLQQAGNRTRACQVVLNQWL